MEGYNSEKSYKNFETDENKAKKYIIKGKLIPLNTNKPKKTFNNKFLIK